MENMFFCKWDWILLPSEYKSSVPWAQYSYSNVPGHSQPQVLPSVLQWDLILSSVEAAGIGCRKRQDGLHYTQAVWKQT